MNLTRLSIADRHRRIAADFAERVRATTDWDAPSPVAEWRARDVLDHLLTWLPGFLAAGGVALSDDHDDDPVAAWAQRSERVQELLDDPERAGAVYSHERVGTMPVEQVLDRFYIADIFMHTWDLARATGQDATLDADFCAALVEGMQPIDDMMRASGQFGPKVDVPVDADPQTRLLGFIGRDPGWTPA